jgi:hypothetical protein
LREYDEYNQRGNAMKSKMQIFEKTNVRSVWDEEQEKWWFSIVDIVGVLTDAEYQTARKYWKVLKGRLAAEGNETVTNCYQLKILAPDGKMRLTDVADAQQVLRLIQSIPSKKAEPFKLWLAKRKTKRENERENEWGKRKNDSILGWRSHPSRAATNSNGLPRPGKIAQRFFSTSLQWKLFGSFLCRR